MRFDISRVCSIYNCWLLWKRLIGRRAGGDVDDWTSGHGNTAGGDGNDGSNHPSSPVRVVVRSTDEPARCTSGSTRTSLLRHGAGADGARSDSDTCDGNEWWGNKVSLLGES